MYDYVFKNALIADGTGKPPFYGDVAVSSSLISEISSPFTLSAQTVIEKPGLVLAPGFIDIHSHSDFEVLLRPGMKDKIGQGITTEVSGNCGVGLFPLLEDHSVLLSLVEDVLGEYDMAWDWSDFKSFKSRIEASGVGINMGFLTSHSAIRLYAMNNDARRSATESEIEKMAELLDSQLKQGSLGFSTGLYYSPCLFADEKELMALLSVVRKNDKIFAVHHRCEGDDILPSLEEILTLSAKTGVQLEISHLKAIGKKNQDKVDQALSMIEKYRSEGLDVKFDQYPYEYGSTSLFSLLPPSIQRLSRIEQRFAASLESERREIKKEMLSPSGWDSIYSLAGPENITILALDSNKELENRILSDIASERGEDPLDTLLDLLSEETGKAVMMDVTQSKENLIKIMKHPLMGFGTDSLFSSRPPHPRTSDAAMHLIREYVSKEKALTLEEAVRKMTGENAERLRLKDRGIIKEGLRADLVLFDKDEGRVDTVLVNGKAAMLDGEYEKGMHGCIIVR